MSYIFLFIQKIKRRRCRSIKAKKYNVRDFSYAVAISLLKVMRSRWNLVKYNSEENFALTYLKVTI